MDIVIDEKTIKKIIERDPKVISERVLLVKYYIKNKRYDEASLINDTLLKYHPKNGEALSLKQTIEYDQKISKAIENSTLYSSSGTYKLKDFDSNSGPSRTLYEALLYFQYDIPLAYHEEMATYYFKQGDMQELQKIFELQNIAPSQHLLRLKAELLFKQEAYQNAYELFHLLHKKSARFDDALAMLKCQIALKDTRAIETYSAMREEFGASQELKSYRQDIERLKVQELQDLQNIYEDKKSFVSLQNYVNALFSNSQQDKAIVQAQVYHREFFSEDSEYFLSQLYYWSGRYDEGINLLTSMQKRMRAKSTLLLGNLYSATKQYDLAKQEYTKLIDHTDEALSYEAQKQLAYILMWEGKRKEAIKSFKALIPLRDDEALEAKLKQLESLEKNPIKYYKRQLKKNPNDYDARFALAQIYLKDKKTHTKGLEELTINAKAQQTEKSFMLLANNAFWCQDNDLAQEALITVLKRSPHHKKALKLQAKIAFMRADQHYNDKAYEQAVTDYDRLSHKYGLDEKRELNRALSLEHLKRHKDAIASFHSMYQKNPDVFIEFHLAYNLLKNGDYHMARGHFKNITEKSPQALPEFLKDFLKKWKDAWESRDFDRYKHYYTDEIADKKVWIDLKKTLISRTKSIKVSMNQICYHALGYNRYTIGFYQSYKSDVLKDSGYKELRVTCKSEENCKIFNETWSKQEIKPSDDLYALAHFNIDYIDTLIGVPEIVILDNGTDLLVDPVIDNNDTHKDDNITVVTQHLEPKKEDNVEVKNEKIDTNSIGMQLNYYTEKNNIEFYSVDGILRRSHLFGTFSGAIDGGYFRISDRNGDVSSGGIRSGVSIYDEHFSLRLGVNKYDEFQEFAPVISYKNAYKSFSYKFEFARQNALFYTKSYKALDNKITANHFEVSSYLYLSETHNLWSSIALNSYSNDNIATIPQFNYRFYRILSKESFYMDSALNGWYMLNSRSENGDYYSPEFYDSTLGALQPTWLVNPYFHLNGSVALGYSVDTESPLYSFALKMLMPERNGFRYELACRESNVAKNGFESIGYYELDCSAVLDYQW